MVTFEYNALRVVLVRGMLKILIISRGFYPDIVGGTEIATYYIFKYLRFYGNYVILITHTRHKKFFKINKYRNGKIIFVPYIPLLGVFLFLFISALIILIEKPNIIHCQAFEIRNIVPFIFKKISKSIVVIWGQGSDVYRKWYFKKIIFILACKYADAIIALSEDMYKALIKKYLRKCSIKHFFILPNGVDLHPFIALHNKTNKLAIRAQLNLKKDGIYIIFVGRLAKIKGLPYLIRAFKKILNQTKNVFLIIIGSGPLLPYILSDNEIRENIIIIGKIPHEIIPNYLLAADIFVLPSISEGVPLSLLEAMAAGLPIIASDVGGIPSIIKNDINGFLVKPADSEELARKMMILIENEKLRDKMRKRNLKDVRKYSWSIIVKKLFDIYEEVFLENSNTMKT